MGTNNSSELISNSHRKDERYCLKQNIQKYECLARIRNMCNKACTWLLSWASFGLPGTMWQCIPHGNTRYSLGCFQ